MTSAKEYRAKRLKERIQAKEKGEPEPQLVVQQKSESEYTTVYTVQASTLDEMAQKIVREHNKVEVQVLTIEKYQWYNIELAKAVSMNENRWLVDWIFEDGQTRKYPPFTVRPIRTHNEGYTRVYERPTVKATNGGVHRWFIPWKHNVECPGFITYSNLPFIHDNLHYRLIDIDFGDGDEEDQIGHYCDWEEYKHYYDLLCEANLKARRIDMSDVSGFQNILQGAAERIAHTLVADKENIWFTGGGFRILMQASSKEILTKVISDLKARKLICPSSTMGYQPQKLFSVQTIKPHFQTEISPFSPMFRYSNPGFFVVKYSKEMLEQLILYYNTYLRRTYFEGKEPGIDLPEKDVYEKMRGEQLCLEKKLISAL